MAALPIFSAARGPVHTSFPGATHFGSEWAQLLRADKAGRLLGQHILWEPLHQTLKKITCIAHFNNTEKNTAKEYFQPNVWYSLENRSDIIDIASRGLRGHAVCMNVINLREDVYMFLRSM